MKQAIHALTDLLWFTVAIWGFVALTLWMVK
jgi:hypothetical protein